MFWTYAFEEIRLPLELLSAMLILLLPFAPKRDRFFIRTLLGFIAAVAFSMLYFVIFGDKLHPRFRIFVVLWYLAIAFSGPLFARFCFHVCFSDALFLGGCAFAMQNIIYCMYHIFLIGVLFPSIRTILPLYIAGALIITGVLYRILYQFFEPVLTQADGTLFPDTVRNRILHAVVAILIYGYLLYFQAAFAQGVSRFDRLSWLAGVMVSVLILMMQYVSGNAIVYAARTAEMERLLQNSAQYYEMSREHIAIINRKCHDLKHQLKILKTVSDEERDEYIAEAERSILFYKDLIHTDNEALNTILAEKGLFCREKGIDFQCSADNADLSFIRVSELYALLGNAIDNAIEYVEQFTEADMRSISLRISSKHSFVAIQVSNPLSEDTVLSRVPKGNGAGRSMLPETTKKDKARHGFGLQSIRYITAKYGGHMEYAAADGLFTLEIVLPVTGCP